MCFIQAGNGFFLFGRRKGRWPSLAVPRGTPLHRPGHVPRPHAALWPEGAGGGEVSLKWETETLIAPH